nr:hypothetical protein [Tanacetum cinerariifolium]
KGKGLLDPNGECGGFIEGRFGESCGGIGGSITKVGEGKVDSTGRMGGGSLAIHSMVSNDGQGDEGGGEVNGGGVDLGVTKRLLLEVTGEMISESGGIEVGEIQRCYRLASRAKVYREPAVVSSGSSAVTYTSVYTDSEQGMPVALPSPNYIPGPEEPHDLDYVPKPIYPEYIPLEDEHVFLVKEQPLPLVDSPTTKSPLPLVIPVQTVHSSPKTRFHNVFVVSQGESLSIHITISFHTHQEMDQQYPTVAKIPILDTGKFEQWQFWIQQYLQHEHYALWESGRTVTLTAEDMQKKKNDIKARTTLLLSLPDEHQLRFSKYKTARELWAAILKTFGGNEATKKTKKNLLKQQYGNFRAEGSETLEQMFSRQQVIVEWIMHTIVWRNKSDLDTMSLDDLYNHLKVYESEVQKKMEPNSQNMAFISSAKHNSENEDGNTACVPTASINVPIASASIDEDDMEEMDIKWNMALLSMRADKFWKRTEKKINIQGSNVTGFEKSKVECFKCHKMSHFARECRAPRSQDRGRRDNFRQGSKAEEQAPKALMAINGVG